MRRSGLALSVLMALLPGCGSKPSVPAKPPEVVQYEQGIKLLQRGNTAEAHAAFDTATRLNAAYAPAFLAEAQIEASSGNTAQAMQHLEALKRAAPQTPHLACRLAEIHAASGHFIESATAAKLALKEEPDCPVAKTQYALVLVSAGETNEATTLMESVHQLAPQTDRVTLMLAQLLARDGRATEAWKLLEVRPASSAMSVQAAYLRGWLLAEYGRDGKRDDKAALQSINSALAQAPGNAEANLEKGRILLRSGQASAALECLQLAGKASSPSFTLLSAVAEAQTKLKHPAAARMKASAHDFAKLVDKLYVARRRYLAAPDDRDNALRLAPLEANMGNAQDAQDLVMAVLKRNPNDTEALKLMTPGDDTTKPKKLVPETPSSQP